jgi:replication factor C subunit 3/5
LQLNASDDRGIDVVREKIVDFAGTKKLFSSGVKLIILDEADAMTNDAQFALRRVIEKYTRNARFCILCNYVSKIIPALQSRCTRFRFAPLKIEDIRSRLTYVGEKEGLGGRLTPDGANAILRLANGDMRKVLNVLQATASGFETVDEDAVYSCTGSPRPADMREILASLLKKTFEESYKGEAKKNTTQTFAHFTPLALPSPHHATILMSLYADLLGFSLKGYALSDIVTELGKLLPALKFPPEVRTILLDKLADVEYVAVTPFTCLLHQ